MTKVVMISTVFPFPIDTGKKVVLAGFVQYLLDRFGAENLAYLFINKHPPHNTTSLPVQTIRLPKALEQVYQAVRYTFLNKEKSLQEAVLFSPSIKHFLHQQLNQLNPDVIFCDTIRLGQYFETDQRPHSRYLLYMDDLFSVRYDKMLGVLKRYPKVDLDPLGNFATFIPKAFHPLAKLPALQRTLLNRERRLMRRRELECLPWFEKNLLINYHEAEFLRNQSGRNNVYPIKPSLPIVQKPLVRQPSSPPFFIFLGALNVPHNRVSLLNFLNSQLPQIQQVLPDAKIKIIGKGASQELFQLAERYPDTLQLAGFVENLDELFAKATAMLVPLEFGSGVKIKTLEALARGLPVIATDFGVEGIPVQNSSNCLIVNNFNDYPQAMLDLTDPNYNRHLSENAYAFYWQNYACEVVYREYDEIFFTA